MNFIEKHLTSIVIVVAFASAFSGYFFYHEALINREALSYQNSSILVAQVKSVAVAPIITPASETATFDGVPRVTSPTHPDTSKWYSNNSPIFQWALPSSATGVSYLITDKATSNPGPKSDGIVSSASFNNLPEGVQYFNIKFKEKGVWGLIAHYRFNIDTTAPDAFSIRTINSEGTQPQISFETTDNLSGIDHYEVKSGDDNSWVILSADKAGQPFRPSFDRIGRQTVYVKAVDKAGNEIIESTSLQVSGVAMGGVIGSWIAKVFDWIVAITSGYILFVVFIGFFIGILIIIYQLLDSLVERLWEHWDNRRRAKKNKRNPSLVTSKLLDTIEAEIDALKIISEHRRLSNEERSLKLKLEQSFKILK